MNPSLKQSFYTIATEPVNDAGDKILFCTRTSEILLIPQKFWLDDDTISIETIPNDLLEKLQQVRAIINSDERELDSIIEENKLSSSSEMLYEVIQPTAMCQLGCDYCGQNHEKVNTSLKLQDAIFERIRKKLSLKKYKRLHIGWFGGEPLLGLPQIRKLTVRLKELCKEFEIEYTCKLVTNGLSLKEGIFLELARELNVRSMEVTLDGTSDYHDMRKHTKEGGKSFDLIFKNLLQIFNRPDFFELNCGISIRCNVDKRNFDSVSELIKLLAKHELQNKISYFYPIGVYSWGNDAHTKSLTKEEFAEKEIDWYIEMFQYGFKPNLVPNRVKQVCLAVSDDSEMYDAYGNVFNCTEVSYVDVYKNSEYSLSNLSTDPLFINKKRPLQNWNDEIKEGLFPCTTCKMLPVCGGACPKSWKEDMRACPPNKFNIKDKLKLSYIVANSNIYELLNETESV
jgi:uncharacterized protein